MIPSSEGISVTRKSLVFLLAKKKKKKESITTQYFYSNLLCKNTERALLDMFTSFAEFIRNETYLMFRKAI